MELKSKKIEFLDGNCTFSIVLSNRKLSILAKCIWCSSVYCCPTDDNPIEMITIESFPPPAWGSFCRPPPTLPIFLKKCGAAAWKIENRILIVIWEKSNRKCIWPYGIDRHVLGMIYLWKMGCNEKTKFSSCLWNAYLKNSCGKIFYFRRKNIIRCFWNYF